MEQVTPKYSFLPKRSYIREGTEIKCFSVVADSGGICDRKLTLSTEPIFVLSVPSDDAAEMLMDDLYYGEYTGA